MCCGTLQEVYSVYICREEREHHALPRHGRKQQIDVADGLQPDQFEFLEESRDALSNSMVVAQGHNVAEGRRILG